MSGWRNPPEPATVIAAMTSTAVWDPEQYYIYADLRLRPALELLSRVAAEAPVLVHDIGTGAGEMARLMAKRWPDARVIGSDSSEEMLTKAKEVESRVEWMLLDLNEWQPEPEHDLIYGNAVLHWLPDHEDVFPRLIAGLRPKGELAIQMPMSWWQPMHETIRTTLSQLGTPQGDRLAQTMSTPNVGQPTDYYKILRPIVSELDIWETTYLQMLSGEDPVFEWVSGSILRPVFSQLPPPDVERFVAECKLRLRAAYPRQPDGTTLFSFRRLFIVARR